MSYDKVKAREAQEWIEEVTGESFSGDFQESLKSGVLLCKLINKLKPGTIAKIAPGKMPFMQMENVASYIAACRTLGIPDHYNFMTVDLYEAKNLDQVILNVLSLKREMGHGFDKSGKQSASAPPAVPVASGADATTTTDVTLNTAPVEFETTVKRTGAALRAGHIEADASKQAPICPICNKAINSGIISACNTTYHPQCFTCKRCGVKLATGKFYEDNNKPYCDRCILIVNPQGKVKAATRDMGFEFSG